MFDDYNSEAGWVGRWERGKPEMNDCMLQRINQSIIIFPKISLNMNIVQLCVQFSHSRSLSFLNTKQGQTGPEITIR